MNQRYPIVSCSAWLHGCGHNEWPEYSNDVLLGVMGMVVSARLVATARQVHEGQPLSGRLAPHDIARRWQPRVTLTPCDQASGLQLRCGRNGKPKTQRFVLQSRFSLMEPTRAPCPPRGAWLFPSRREAHTRAMHPTIAELPLVRSSSPSHQDSACNPDARLCCHGNGRPATTRPTSQSGAPARAGARKLQWFYPCGTSHCRPAVCEESKQ